mmetsp:Transcript_41090/g.70312  ORF Transcript_41090/g.70312 Transcript_41090/m.70312 type:complete len:86 (-) Transcript_41090:925-1182(-)
MNWFCHFYYFKMNQTSLDNKDKQLMSSLVFAGFANIIDAHATSQCRVTQKAYLIQHPASRKRTMASFFLCRQASLASFFLASLVL